MKPILVICDKPDDLAHITTQIKELGYHVIPLPTPHEASAVLSRVEPLVALGDSRFDNNRGEEFLEAAKQKYTNLTTVLWEPLSNLPSSPSPRDSQDEAGLDSKPSIDKIIKEQPNTEDFAQQFATISQKAEEKLAQEKIENKDIVDFFVEEAGPLIKGLERQLVILENNKYDCNQVDDVFRILHTFKGGALSLPGGKHMGILSHRFENLLVAIREGNTPQDSSCMDHMLKATDLIWQLLLVFSALEEPDMELFEKTQQAIIDFDFINHALKNSSRVALTKEVPVAAASAPTALAPEARKLEDLIQIQPENLSNLTEITGELAVTKNYFGLLLKEMRKDELHGWDEQLVDIEYNLQSINTNLQKEVMKIQQVRLEKNMVRIQRIVRDGCKQLNKKIRVTCIGEDIGIDRQINELISQMMIHLVRNSMDHGIEDPQQRLSLGKPLEGHIKVIAQKSKDFISIEIIDDGRGIDPEKVAKKALEKGVIHRQTFEKLTEYEKIQLIFHPGLSTAEKITDISGRGVGMDSVKSGIESIQGSIEIRSDLGKGTTTLLKLPLPKSVLIEETILVRNGPTHIAIPIEHVKHFMILQKDAFILVGSKNRCMIRHMDKIYPLMSMSLILGTDNENLDDTEMVILVEFKKEVIGIAVDEVLGHFDAVTHPMTGYLEPDYLNRVSIINKQIIAFVINLEDVFNDFVMCSSSNSAA